MWPQQVHPAGGASGLPAAGRRAVLMGSVGIAGLLFLVALSTWMSVRGSTASGAVYTNVSPGAAGLWTWDGSTYRLHRVGSPGPASNDAEMAYDRARAVIVLWDHGCTRLVMGFEGGCMAQAQQTWTWSGGAWIPHSPHTVPLEVGPGAMLYDVRLGSVAYVNGAGQAWAWNGSDWAPEPMAGGPRVPRPGSASTQASLSAGYDEGRDQLVLALSASTWLWDGRTWTEVQGGIDASETRPDAHVVYDRARRELVYVGRRFTWTWDGARWLPHAQPGIAAGTLAYDPVRRTVLLVQEDASACDRQACPTTSWTWDGSRWSPLAVPKGPLLPLTRSGAYPPPMAFDEARGSMVYFASGS